MHPHQQPRLGDPLHAQGPKMWLMVEVHPPPREEGALGYLDNCGQLTGSTGSCATMSCPDIAVGIPQIRKLQS